MLCCQHTECGHKKGGWTVHHSTTGTSALLILDNCNELHKTRRCAPFLHSHLSRNDCVDDAAIALLGF
jgi:hypothetical protein